MVAAIERKPEEGTMAAFFIVVIFFETRCSGKAALCQRGIDITGKRLV